MAIYVEESSGRPMPEIEKIRKSVPTSQEPVLHEDAGNLSAVLFNLMTEHAESFEELKAVIKSAIPGFRDLNVKARGGPGEVIAFWQEENIDTDLSLANFIRRHSPLYCLGDFMRDAVATDIDLYRRT